MLVVQLTFYPSHLMPKFLFFVVALLVSGLVAPGQGRTQVILPTGLSDLMSVTELLTAMEPQGTRGLEVGTPKTPDPAAAVVAELLDPLGEVVVQCWLPLAAGGAGHPGVQKTPAGCSLRIGQNWQSHAPRVAKQ